MYSPRKILKEAEEWYDLKIKLEKERQGIDVHPIPKYIFLNSE